MNGRKKYKGELYSFFRSERNIGSGGNGAVYDVEFEGDEGFEFPIVAKFFEYGGVDKEKRYNRFKNGGTRGQVLETRDKSSVKRV